MPMRGTWPIVGTSRTRASGEESRTVPLRGPSRVRPHAKDVLAKSPAELVPKAEGSEKN